MMIILNLRNSEFNFILTVLTLSYFSTACYYIFAGISQFSVFVFVIQSSVITIIFISLRDSLNKQDFMLKLLLNW